MKFTFYGHASFLVEIGGKKILFDPFVTGNPLAKDIDIYAIEADYILVSHGHGDHVGDLVTIAKHTKATVVANFEIVNWLNSQGVSNAHPMNFGPRDFDFGRVHYVPAQHSSSLPDGSYAGNPGGFVVKTDDFSFYYSGDTCLSMEMQLIPKYARLDVAILPVGGNFTMDADEAALAADMVQCNKVVGVHFDTFGYIVINHEAAKKIFGDQGKELILPEIGATIEL
ncbi:MAG: metal-dependent hydrolase [Edaphocola sp.]